MKHLPTLSGRPRLELFLTSFALLFFEMICIRWVPAQVRFLGFFSNFILLASFLGIGTGILAGRRWPSLFSLFPGVLILLVGLVLVLRYDVSVGSVESLYFAPPGSVVRAENFLVLPLIFIVVAAAFVPLAAPLARLLSALSPARAYAIDIIGSLAGIAVFAIASYLWLPPVVWFGTLGLLVIVLGPKRRMLVSVAVLAEAAILVHVMDSEALWSPYYRIRLDRNDAGTVIVSVNNQAHQEIKTHGKKESIYYRAYDLLPERPFKRVLVLGAGTGSDVSIALAQGAEHVDAVEIDPRILDIGRKLHPDRPYQDPRVAVHIDDGRAFLRQTSARFDLVIFAMPDSLTLTSALSSMRLESFLLTAESIGSACRHLSPDGLLVLYNAYRQDWLIAKLAAMVEAGCGEAPYVTTYGAYGRAAVLMAGPRLGPHAAILAAPWVERGDFPGTRHGSLVPVIGHGRMGRTGTETLAVDDWPFFYMRERVVPGIFLGSLGLVILIALGCVGVVSHRQNFRFEWHFFLLGAAFMLLETRSLTTFGLLFGTTWMVNALVFFAILCSVLAALFLNVRTGILRASRWYLLLVAALIVAFVIPLEALLGIVSGPVRYTLACAITFAPVFFANLVFTHSFTSTRTADIAFASNMLGMIAGGLLEYSALVVGYRALLLLALGLYLGAWATRRSPTEFPAAGNI